MELSITLPSPSSNSTPLECYTPINFIPIWMELAVGSKLVPYKAVKFGWYGKPKILYICWFYRALLISHLFLNCHCPMWAPQRGAHKVCKDKGRGWARPLYIYICVYIYLYINYMGPTLRFKTTALICYGLLNIRRDWNSHAQWDIFALQWLAAIT